MKGRRISSLVVLIMMLATTMSGFAVRKEKPDILARYFQLKRRIVDPAKRARYTADDSVEVLSRAMGRDLFPWFVSLGISVDKSRVEDL